MYDGICELVLESSDLGALERFYRRLGPDVLARHLRDDGVTVEGPVEHEGGDRSIDFSDPEGDRVELWDFFRDGDGDDALAQPDAP